jgi:hypothetical protein
MYLMSLGTEEARASLISRCSVENLHHQSILLLYFPHRLPALAVLLKIVDETSAVVMSVYLAQSDAIWSLY